MATDREKLGMLDRAYACDVGRKLALEVAKHLTTLETRDLDDAEEGAVRAKLSSARKAWREAWEIVAQLISEPILVEKSDDGPLFDATPKGRFVDAVAKELNKTGILAEVRG